MDERQRLDTLIKDNRPGIFSEFIRNWPALQLWHGSSGTQRLIDLAGDVDVPIMVAQNGKFDGDMEHLVLFTSTLQSFLLRSISSSRSIAADMNEEEEEEGTMYLAQCPIVTYTKPYRQIESGPLQALKQDFKVPTALENKPLTQINFWASVDPTQSSLHYDPHHNLLCVVTGSKTVRVVNPGFTSKLDPRPPYHDSANHASEDLFDQDILTKISAMSGLKEFKLRPGDALLIPEGWWHQVQSSAGTCAINFWWDSEFSQQLASCRHMHGYYLRRVVQTTVETRKESILQSQLDCSETAAAVGSLELLAFELARDPEANVNLMHTDGFFLQLPDGSHFLCRSLTLVEAAAVKLLCQKTAHTGTASTSTTAATTTQSTSTTPSIEDILFALARDGFQPLMRVLLTLRCNYQEAANHLLLNCMTPMTWELLTSGVERWGQQSSSLQEIQPQYREAAIEMFYDGLYEVVGNREVLLQGMLEAKQAFTKAVMKRAVAHELML